MPDIEKGKFAIFQGEVGIIVGTKVPIDESGRPTNPIGAVVNQGVEQTPQHGETKYYAVEFHPIDESGTTKMRLVEDEKGNPVRVETDIKYLVGDAVNLLEILESTDERIPESRRLSA